MYFRVKETHVTTLAVVDLELYNGKQGPVVVVDTSCAVFLRVSNCHCYKEILVTENLSPKMKDFDCSLIRASIISVSAVFV